jgi:hypothetical protein
MRRRPGGLAVLVAAAALGLAACSSGSSTPQVASLGSSSDGSGNSAGNADGGGSSAATGAGNATQLLDEWAVCIRSHGDPGQADPTIDSNKDIQITMNNVSVALEDEVHGSTGPCSSYLQAASKVLLGGQPAPKAPSLAQQLKYAECMRANGVPKFPDPNGPNGSGRTYIGDLNPDGPVFQNADKVCTRQAGEPYYAPGTEVPGVVVVTGCNGPVSFCSKTPPPGGGNRSRPAPGGSGGSGNG